MKKILLFVLLGIITICTARAQSGTTGNLTWRIENDTLTISGVGAMPNYSVVWVGGTTITNAPWGEFRNSFAVLVIKEGVTSIGNFAFTGCTKITTVSIPSSVVTIGTHAFRDCSSIVVVYNFRTTPQSITNMEFNGANLSVVNLFVPEEAALAYRTAVGWRDFGFVNNERVTGVLTWNIANGTLTISGTGEMPNYSATGIPAITTAPWGVYRNSFGVVVIEDGVTSIGSQAFRGTNLVSVSIPNSVTRFGTGAFMRSGLTSITIPDGVITIGDDVFYDCTRLTSVDFGNSVTTIGSRAFMGCTRLTSATIPNSVTTIGEWAFRDCTNLTTVSIPNSVTTIERGAFMRTGLTSVTIPNSVTTIESYLFENCRNLTSITIPNSVTTIGDWAFSGCTGLTSIDIPNSVTSIGRSTFSSSGLTSVIIPNNVTSIGELAFAGTPLTSVIIGNSVTTIGDRAFERCTGLTSVIIPNSVITIGTMAFNGCTNLTSVNIGNSVTMIGNLAFNRTGLTSVDIPNSVTTIGRNAFEDCTRLTSVSIGNNVITIGDRAFRNSGLTSVTIPNSVTQIGNNAFESTNITSVTIGSGVTSIGNEAFRNCTRLTSVHNLSAIPQRINTNVFSGVTLSNLTLYVYDFALPAYQDAPVWEDFGNIIGIPSPSVSGTTDNLTWNIANGVLTISGTGAMPNYSIIDGVTTAPWGVYRNYFINVIIEDGVTSIGSNAFIGTNTTSVNIGNDVISIGNSAFSGCTDLTSVIIPNSVITIGQEAFFGCRNLTSVTIGSNVITIGERAFRDCWRLASVYNLSLIPQIINRQTFDGHTLHNATLFVPEDAIPDYQNADVWKDFGSIISIESLSIIAQGTSGAEGDNITWVLTTDSILTIGGNGDMMNYASSANNIHTRNNVSTNDAPNTPWFSYREAIQTVVIENGVTNIGDWAFYDCRNLISVSIPNTVTTIGSHAFEDCISLVSIVIPESVTSIGRYVFWGCTSLVSIDVESENLYFASENGVLFDKSKTTLIRYPIGKSDTAYIIPNSVEVISEGAFADCTALTSVTIPANLTTIGELAFAFCIGLTSIVSYALTPPTLGDFVFVAVNRSSVSLYVPAQSAELYRQTSVWQDFLIKPMREEETSGNEIQTPKIFIFPNPVADSFQIGGIKENTLVIISDINGRIVMQRIVSPNEMIPAGHLSQGTYFVNAGGKTMKIIK